jgi:hypothetical protein
MCITYRITVVLVHCSALKDSYNSYRNKRTKEWDTQKIGEMHRKSKIEKTNGNEFDGWQMQEACKQRYWHVGCNTLADEDEMDHKLGTKGTVITDGCKRNEERQRSDHTQGKKWGWCFYFSNGHYNDLQRNS